MKSSLAFLAVMIPGFLFIGWYTGQWQSRTEGVKSFLFLMFSGAVILLMDYAIDLQRKKRTLRNSK